MLNGRQIFGLSIKWLFNCTLVVVSPLALIAALLVRAIMQDHPEVTSLAETNDV